MSSNLPEKFTYPFCYTPHPLIVKAAESLCRRIASDPSLNAIFAPGKMLGVLMVAKKDSEIGSFEQRRHSFNNSESVTSEQRQPSFNDSESVTSEQRQPSFNNSESVTSEQRQPSFNDSEIVTPEQYPNEGSFNRGNRQPVACEAQATGRAGETGSENSFVGLKSSQSNDSEIVTSEQREPSFNDSEIVTPEQYPNEGSFNRGKRQPVACEAQATGDGDEVDFLFGFSGLVGGRSLIDGFVPPIFDTASVDIDSSSHEESIRLQNWLFEQYVVSNALGERLTVLDIFARRGLVPPGGTGDCAAPKLLQYAYSHNLKPLAMGEFWYGASPRGEVRRHGCFYPSCTGKCGPLLGFMLQGLDVEPNPLDNDNLWSLSDPVVKYEDSDIIVVDKPSGMLSVPGRTSRRSLQDWLSDYCGCDIYACHRLDMDTSGLMVFAKTAEAQENIQRQFENREVRKQYLAHLCPAGAATPTPTPTSTPTPDLAPLATPIPATTTSTTTAAHDLAQVQTAAIEAAIEAVGKEKIGETGERESLGEANEAGEPSEAVTDGLSQHPALKPGDTGKISLPLMLDYYDRPRQKVDFADGKPAVTGYEVLRELPGGCLEVRFTPFTGRTHQLRVHAAHALGLGRPILGDRLYGGLCGGHDCCHDRLMLHASLLSFRHPTTGARLHFTSAVLPEQ